jgi:hypothetical protein
MKVTFKHMIGGFTGSIDELVYYYDSRLRRVLARRKPKVKISLRHLEFGETAKNLMRINPSEKYKDDLRAYAERTYNLPEFGGVRPLWNNLYMRIMFAMKKDDPSLDLLNITRAYIELHDLPCRTVQRAIDAGYLPEVRDWQSLTHEL